MHPIPPPPVLTLPPRRLPARLAHASILAAILLGGPACSEGEEGASEAEPTTPVEADGASSSVLGPMGGTALPTDATAPQSTSDSTGIPPDFRVPPPWPQTTPLEGERFTWMKQALGQWYHTTSWSGDYRMPESIAGGCGILDYDVDGDPDLFLVQAGIWEDLTPEAPYPGHALLRNDGDLKFTDVAREAGVFGEVGAYCCGMVAGDLDNDGDPDLYVSAFERNYLYRNAGDGSFAEVAEAAGAAGLPVWSVSCCLLDGDGDGFLDIYVVNYCDYTHATNKRCGVGITGIRDYCSPKEYNGLQDFYFHNQGDGTFREVAADVGLKATGPLASNAKGLGCVSTDVEDDGDPDLYVTNDATANFLFLNDGEGRFTEEGWMRGVGLGASGQAQAGMGTDAGDFDGDGDFDLWVVHLDFETNALYVNDGNGYFEDKHDFFGLKNPASKKVGFGTDFFDWNNDGLLDLMVTNGHVLANVQDSRQVMQYKQHDQLFLNEGAGRMSVVPAEEAGSYFLERLAGRGLATSDLDGDGDLDVLLAPRDDRPVLLRNNHAGPGGATDALLLDLVGVTDNRDAVGARVRVTVGDRVLVDEVRAGTSFGSCNDLRLHFGLGEAGRADRVEIRWRDGTVEVHEDLAGGAEYRIEQGAAPVRLRALAGR